MNFLKTNWIWILAGVILFILFFGYIHSCTTKKTDAKIETSSDASVKKLTIDSMRIVQSYALIAQHDSLSVFYEKQAKEAGKQAKTYIDKSKDQSKVTDQAKQVFKKDSTISECKDIVESQDQDLSYKDSTITHLDYQITYLSSSLNECRDSGIQKDSVNGILKDENKVIVNDFSVYKTQTAKKEKSSKFWSGVKNIGLSVLAGLLIVKSL
jgi:hypothetical protein